MLGIGNFYSLLMKIQTDAATLQISMKFPQDGKRNTYP